MYSDLYLPLQHKDNECRSRSREKYGIICYLYRVSHYLSQQLYLIVKGEMKMKENLHALFYINEDENRSLELKTMNYPDDLSSYLGDDYKQELRIVNRMRFLIHKSKDSNKMIIAQVNSKEEPLNMSLLEAYDWMYGIKWPLLPVTDLRGLDEEELAEEGELLDAESVSWEATVSKREHEDEIFTIEIDFSFYGKYDYDEQQIGAAAVTILNGYEPPYDILEQADYISGVYVYALNGVPVYDDEFEMSLKMERGRKPGVFGKVAIVTDTFIAGPYLDEKKARKPVIESMIDYFENVQHVDFLVIHPNLSGVFDCDSKGKTKEEILEDTAETNRFLQNELGFIGSGETTDGLYYSIDGLYKGYEPSVDPKTKEDFIQMMNYCISKGELDKTIQVIDKGHNLGIAECTYELAMLHYIGAFGEPEPEQAYEYLYELAQDNFAPAMYQVSQMLFKGEGVRKDALMGMMWLEKAAQKGEEQAVNMRNKFQETQIKIAESGGLYKHILSEEDPHWFEEE